MSVERPDAESDDSSDSDREREAVADLATESLDGDGGRTGAGDFSDHVTDFTDGHMVRKDDSGGADAAMHALGMGSGRQASSSVVVKTTYFLQSDPASAAASASSNQPADGAYQGGTILCAPMNSSDGDCFMAGVNAKGIRHARLKSILKVGPVHCCMRRCPRR